MVGLTLYMLPNVRNRNIFFSNVVVTGTVYSEFLTIYLHDIIIINYACKLINDEGIRGRRSHPRRRAGDVAMITRMITAMMMMMMTQESL